MKPLAQGVLALFASAALAACGDEPPRAPSAPGTARAPNGSVAAAPAEGNAASAEGPPSGNTTGGFGFSGTGAASRGTSSTTDPRADRIGGSGTGGTATAPTSAGAAVTPGTSSLPSGAGTQPSDTSRSGGGDRRAAKEKGTLAVAERTFVVNAMAANMAEASAARMAAERASDAAVKAYAQMLVEQHSRMGDELREFAGRHDVPLPDQMPAPRRQALDRLAKSSGNEFDRLFIEQVGLKDHQEVIRMYEAASRNARNAELKSWIDRTLPLLREHLAQAGKLPSGGARGATGAKTG